jgi:quercetin dioxygenase-like cupin family protein
MSFSESIVRRDEAESLRAMGVDVHFLCRAEATGGAWSLIETVVPRDAGPPPHRHPWGEAYYVTEGTAEFEVGNRRELVGSGDFLYVPGGTVHGFRGASETPARMLIFDAPAHAEGFFRDVEREVTEMPRDLAKVPVIGQRHGIEFLPPPA